MCLLFYCFYICAVLFLCFFYVCAVLFLCFFTFVLFFINLQKCRKTFPHKLFSQADPIQNIKLKFRIVWSIILAVWTFVISETYLFEKLYIFTSLSKKIIKSFVVNIYFIFLVWTKILTECQSLSPADHSVKTSNLVNLLFVLETIKQPDKELSERTKQTQTDAHYCHSFYNFLINLQVDVFL